jgi:hypothetical protein
MRAIRKILNTTPEEDSRILTLALGWAFITGFTIAGKAARDAIFLSRYDRSYLPLMVVAIAIAVSIAVAAFSKLTRFAKPRQILAVAAPVVAASMFLFGSRLQGWTIPVLYVWVEIATVILGLEFWLMASELVDSRQAKRLFGLVAGGGSVAAIIVGSQLKPFVKLHGAPALLPLIAAFALAAGLIAVFAARLTPAPQPAPKRRTETTPSRKFDGYLTSIAIVVCAAAVGSTLIDYQFKIIAAREIRSEADLAGFFGMFSAATGLSSLIFQFLLTGRILSSLGIIAGLALLPLGLGISSAFILVTPVLAAAALAKFSDQTLKFTVHNSGLECLWLPVPYARRQEMKPWITGTLKSSAEGFSGLATFFIVKFVPLSLLSLLVLGACAFWVWTLMRLRGFYSRVLEDALRSRAIDYDELAIDAHDPKIVAILERSLTSGDETEQLFALELIEEMPLGPWATALRTLMKTGSPKVQRRILELAADDIRVIPDQMVIDAIGTESAVTESAIRTALKRRLPDLPTWVSRVLAESHPGVRAAAARALYQMGVAREQQEQTIRDMLKGSEQEQVAALKELAEVPEVVPDQVLIGFLHAPSTMVREAALKIAAARGSLELIPQVLDCLSNRETAIAARLALLRFPPDAVLQQIGERLKLSLTIEQRVAHVRVLRYFPADKASALLCTQLVIKDPPVTLHVPDSLLVLCRQTGPRPEVLRQAEMAGKDWIHLAYVAGESSRLLPASPAATLLRDHFEHCYSRSLAGLLKLLALRRPSVPVENCLQIIQTDDKSRLSFVLDLLDSFLPVAERRQVVPLFEGAPEKRAEAGRRFFTDLPTTLDDVLLASIRSGRDWDQAIGLDFTFREDTPFVFQSESTLPCAGPLSAEILAHVLRSNPDIQLHVDPPNLIGPAERSLSMYSTLEKTIILKSANLFSSIAAETLSRVAQMAEEVAFNANDSIYREGDAGTALFVVASGAVKARVGSTDLAILRRGEPFGEIAVLKRDFYRADVSAIEDTVLLKIAGEDMFDLMQSNSEIMQGVIGLLADRVVQVGGLLRQSAQAGG